MGLPNFLPQILEHAGRNIDLRNYSPSSDGLDQGETHDDADAVANTGGLRIAMDASNWIYKACSVYSDILADERHMSNFGRAMLMQLQKEKQDSSELTQNETEIEEFVSKCCSYVVEAIQSVVRGTYHEYTSHNILVVFDGRTPPIKMKTSQVRRMQRSNEEMLRDRPVDPTADPVALHRRIQANKRTGAGSKLYGVVVDAVLAALRCHQIPFLVAPYEADGQLAYLQQQGYVDLVITEDSDLLAYGLYSPVLLKLSINPEQTLTRGVLMRREDLGASAHMLVQTKRCDFMDFSPSMMACVFAAAGCDYCPNLKGIGSGTATKLVRQSFLKRNDSNEPPLSHLIRLLLAATQDRNTLTNSDREKFAAEFLAAVYMFRHCLVWDPITGQCRPLVPVGSDTELSSYPPYRDLHGPSIVGPSVPSPVVTHIAEGWVYPGTLQFRDHENVPAWVKKDMEEYRRGEQLIANSNNKRPNETMDDDLGTSSKRNVFNYSEMETLMEFSTQPDFSPNDKAGTTLQSGTSMTADGVEYDGEDVLETLDIETEREI